MYKLKKSRFLPNNRAMPQLKTAKARPQVCSGSSTTTINDITATAVVVVTTATATALFYSNLHCKLTNTASIAFTSLPSQQTCGLFPTSRGTKDFNESTQTGNAGLCECWTLRGERTRPHAAVAHLVLDFDFPASEDRLSSNDRTRRKPRALHSLRTAGFRDLRAVSFAISRKGY